MDGRHELAAMELLQKVGKNLHIASVLMGKLHP
jgi:hypothetical protein